MFLYFSRILFFASRSMVLGSILWAFYTMGGVSWIFNLEFKPLFPHGQLLLSGLGLLPVAYLLERIAFYFILRKDGKVHLMKFLSIPKVSFMAYVISYVLLLLSLNGYWFTKWGIPGGELPVIPVTGFVAASFLGFLFLSLLLFVSGQKLSFWYSGDDDDDDDDDE